jgi:hypothetical protein
MKRSCQRQTTVLPLPTARVMALVLASRQFSAGSHRSLPGSAAKGTACLSKNPHEEAVHQVQTSRTEDNREAAKAFAEKRAHFHRPVNRLSPGSPAVLDK